MTGNSLQFQRELFLIQLKLTSWICCKYKLINVVTNIPCDINMNHTSGKKTTFLRSFIVSSSLLICGTYYCTQLQETSDIYLNSADCNRRQYGKTKLTSWDKPLGKLVTQLLTIFSVLYRTSRFITVFTTSPKESSDVSLYEGSCPLKYDAVYADFQTLTDVSEELNYLPVYTASYRRKPHNHHREKHRMTADATMKYIVFLHSAANFSTKITLWVVSVVFELNVMRIQEGIPGSYR
jgi:hypothetical protein